MSTTRRRSPRKRQPKQAAPEVVPTEEDTFESPSQPQSGVLAGSSSASAAAASSSKGPSIEVEVESSSSSDGDEDTKKDDSSRGAGRRRASGVPIKDRMWERQELQNITIRVDNILSHLKDCKSAGNLDPEAIRGVMELEQYFNGKLDELSDDYRNKAQQWIDDIEQLRSDNRTKQQEVDRLQEANADLRGKNRGLEQKARDLTNENSNALRDKDRAETELRTLKDDHDAQIKTLRDRNLRQAREIARLQNILTGREDDLKERFAEQLARIIEEREEQYEEGKKQMTDVFAEQMRDLQKKNEDDLKALRAQLKDQSEEMDALNKDLDKIKQERDDVRDKYEKERDAREKLEDILRAERQSRSNSMEAQKKAYKDLKDAYNRLSQEFFMINDMNTELQSDLEKLNRKLDDFEQYHHIASPLKPGSRKRRRISATPDQLEEPMESAAMEEDDESAAAAQPVPPVLLDSLTHPGIVKAKLFPLACITRQYSGEWRGFELSNQWDRPIRLMGWQLANKDGSHVLPIPDQTLQPDGVLRVVMGDKKTADTDLLWRGNFRFDRNKSEALWVHDDSGNKQLLDSIPANHELNCFVM